MPVPLEQGAGGMRAEVDRRDLGEVAVVIDHRGAAPRRPGPGLVMFICSASVMEIISEERGRQRRGTAAASGSCCSRDRSGDVSRTRPGAVQGRSKAAAREAGVTESVGGARVLRCPAGSSATSPGRRAAAGQRLRRRPPGCNKRPWRQPFRAEAPEIAGAAEEPGVTRERPRSPVPRGTGRCRPGAAQGRRPQVRDGRP